MAVSVRFAWEWLRQRVVLSFALWLAEDVSRWMARQSDARVRALFLAAGMLVLAALWVAR